MFSSFSKTGISVISIVSSPLKEISFPRREIPYCEKNNRPRSIYQYSNMASRLWGQNDKFLKFLLYLNSQKRLGYKENNTKYKSLTWKPRSHARIPPNSPTIPYAPLWNNPVYSKVSYWIKLIPEPWRYSNTSNFLQRFIIFWPYPATLIFFYCKFVFVLAGCDSGHLTCVIYTASLSQERQECSSCP